MGKQIRPGEVDGYILVVHSSQEEADRVAKALQKRGYQAETLLEGEAALERLKRDPPALLFVEEKMASIDGWEILRFVRNTDGIDHLPFIFLSDGPEEHLENRKGYFRTFDMLLMKPYNLKNVTDFADRLLLYVPDESDRIMI